MNAAETNSHGFEVPQTSMFYQQGFLASLFETFERLGSPRAHFSSVAQKLQNDVLDGIDAVNRWLSTPQEELSVWDVLDLAEDGVIAADEELEPVAELVIEEGEDAITEEKLADLTPRSPESEQIAEHVAEHVAEFIAVEVAAIGAVADKYAAPIGPVYVSAADYAAGLDLIAGLDAPAEVKSGLREIYQHRVNHPQVMTEATMHSGLGYLKELQGATKDGKEGVLAQAKVVLSGLNPFRVSEASAVAPALAVIGFTPVVSEALLSALALVGSAAAAGVLAAKVKDDLSGSGSAVGGVAGGEPGSAPDPDEDPDDDEKQRKVDWKKRAGHDFDSDDKDFKEWEIKRYDEVKYHDKFGKFYRDPKTGLWWSKDKAGHGGSAWKVFKEFKGELKWFKDADKFGQFIEGKHKGETGVRIVIKHLKGVK